MQIRFMGLICHVSRDEAAGRDEDIAVLIRENLHLPRLRIRKGHLFGEDPGDPDIICKNLTGVVLRFSELGAGVADRAGLVDVPSLDGQGGNGAALHPHVATRDTSGNLLSFVILPEGSYGIEDRFANHGTLATRSDPKCIARTVTYDAIVPAGVTKITITGLQNGETLELKPSAIFSITNLEPYPNPKSHFHQYSNMFASSVTIANVVPSTELCDSGSTEYVYETCSDEPYKNVGVECSNTDYP